MPNLPIAKKWCFVDFFRGKKFFVCSVFVHASIVGVLFKNSSYQSSKNKDAINCSLVTSESVISSPSRGVLTEALKQEQACLPENKTTPRQNLAELFPPSGGTKGGVLSRIEGPPRSIPPSAGKGGAFSLEDQPETGLSQTSPAPDQGRPPVLLSDHIPNLPYPAEAKHLRVEGVVKLELTIDEEGQVKDAKVIEGLGFGLTTQALRLVKMLRFLPALNPRGEREMASIMHEVVFRLNRQNG